jgi:hypothetical protein
MRKHAVVFVDVERDQPSIMEFENFSSVRVSSRRRTLFHQNAETNPR